jgi:Tol biopolymer transport system component
MGEVYRARDTKLHRDVAIKVLLPIGANDPERLARFRREAHVLAALNQPNIAAIYGLEDSTGVPALVMELVEGPTLADRIARGPMPLPAALPVAKQIAEALEAAHERGIVHRDLKPANIKLKVRGAPPPRTEDGRLERSLSAADIADCTVKVLDFGLAKAFAGDPSDPDVSLRPTVSAGGTREGMILGTAAYMSPEQARGEAVDKRTDIWAFGCVLYEMLTGAPAFGRHTITDTLAAIVHQDVKWDALPAATPAPVLKLLRRCLAKDRRQRLADAADVRLELEDALNAPAANAATLTGPALQTGRHTERRRAAFVAIGAFLVGGLIVGVAVYRVRQPIAAPTAVTKITVPVPSGFVMGGFGQIPGLAISPDGRRIVFEAEGRLHARLLDGFNTEPIPDTDGATQPFFSPDGAWLGFVVGNTLMKMPAAGGPAATIAEAYISNGVDWGPDDRIVFSGALGNGGVWGVSADGGTPQQLTVVSESEGETMHTWPDLLPDGSMLYTALGPSGHVHDARLVVEDVASHRRTLVAEGVTYGRYLASGHLLSANESGTLLLQPFDLRARRTTGPAQAVLAGVRMGAVVGAAAYAVSSTGTLVYATGTELAPGILTEVDQAGRERRQFGAPGFFDSLTLSPDGQTLALMIRSTTNDDIHLLDLTSGQFRRFTFGAPEDESPVWSPDGTHIAYSSAWVGEQRRILVKPVAEGEPERLLYTSSRPLHLYSWSPDGRWLAFNQFEPRSADVWMLDVENPSRVLPVATSAADERGGHFSPDGRWLEFGSDETKRFELFAVSVPDLGTKQMITREGAGYPQWSPAGQDLFFWDRLGLLGGGRMMKTRRVGGSLWRTPVPLFEVSPRSSVMFAVAKDGKSFYTVKANPDAPAREILVVVNWLQDVLSRGAGPHP